MEGSEEKKEQKKEREPAGRRRYGRAVEAYCWARSGASGGFSWQRTEGSL